MEKNKYRYNSWPLGQIPKELQRSELDQIKELGYEWSDPRDVIDIFENKVAKFAGSKYAVSCDCCSNGIFLSLMYLQQSNQFVSDINVTIPLHTYVSIPMQIMHARYGVNYEDIEWSGIYQLKPFQIWDGAGRWTEGMYVRNNALHVLSFQIKKRIPIGRGGMILTNSEHAYQWLKLATYDGRDLTLPYTHENHVQQIGYHMYMTPEDAARGIILIDSTPDVNEDTQNNTMYPDLKEMLKNIKT